MKVPNKYAIGAIIQSGDTLNKWRNIASTIKNSIVMREVTEYDYIDNGWDVPPTPVPKQVEHFFLKDKPDAEITFFIGIAQSVSPSIRNAIGTFADRDNTYFLPSISFMYFGSSYPLDEMKQKLFLWMDDRWEGYLLIDSGSDLSNLITKFIL